MIESAEEYESLLESDAENVTNRFKAVTASEATWREIISRYPQHRTTVALNITLPDSIHKLLAADDDKAVRSMLADRRQLSIEVLEMLAADTAATVRARVCANRKTPEALLIKLTGDSESWVAVEARNRLEERRLNTKA